MPQASPLSIIQLPKTIEDVAKHLQATLDFYKAHLPAIIEAERPDIGINSTSTAAYAAQLREIFTLMHVTGMPNPETFNFDSIQFNPEALTEYLKASLILESSIVYAYTEGNIDDTLFENEGKQLLCTLALPLMFGYNKKMETPLVQQH